MNFSDLQKAALKRLEERVYKDSLTEEKVKNLFFKVVDGLSKGITEEGGELFYTRILKITTSIQRTPEISEISRTRMFRKLIKSAGISKEHLEYNEDKYHIDGADFNKFIKFCAKVEEENIEKAIEEEKVKTK